MEYTKEQIEWMNDRIVEDKDGNNIIGMCEYLAEADSLESDYQDRFGDGLALTDEFYNYYFDSVNCECQSHKKIDKDTFEKYKKYILEDTNPIIEETLKGKVKE